MAVYHVYSGQRHILTTEDHAHAEKWRALVRNGWILTLHRAETFEQRAKAVAA